MKDPGVHEGTEGRNSEEGVALYVPMVELGSFFRRKKKIKMGGYSQEAKLSERKKKGGPNWRMNKVSWEGPQVYQLRGTTWYC